MTTEPTVQRMTLRVVCTSHTIVTGGSVCPVLRPIHEDGSLGDPLYYKKLKGKIFVGQVATIDAADAEGTIVWLSSLQITGLWPDETQRFAWQTADRAWTAAQDAERFLKKEARRDLLAERLQPLHELYMSTNGQGRRALEILVLQALRNGNPASTR